MRVGPILRGAKLSSVEDINANKTTVKSANNGAANNGSLQITDFLS